MPDYLLVPKQPLWESEGLSVEDDVEARAQLDSVAEGFAADAAYVLEGLGLRRDDESGESGPVDEPSPEASVPDFLPRPEDADQPSFARLPYIGAIVATFESEAEATQAATVLPEYDFVPDIPLTLMQTAPSSLQLIKKDDAAPEWPEASGIAAAHAAGVRGAGVFVGVLDSGFDADHIEFAETPYRFRYVSLKPPRYREIRGFDVSGHGTHVSGIIAGATMGVAPEVSLHVAAVIESETHLTSLSRVFQGLDWINRQVTSPEHRAKPAIVNLSLGWLDSWLTNVEVMRVRGPVRRMFQVLSFLNVLLVVAVGNEGHGHVRGPGYLPEAFAVGAVDANETPCTFSGGGVGPINNLVKPDIAGFGLDIISCVERSYTNDNYYGRKRGSSMASAYVTGIAALYASADPTLKGASLRSKIVSTAKSLSYTRDRVGDGLARYV